MVMYSLRRSFSSFFWFMLIYDIKIYREKFMKSLTLSLFSFPLSKYSIALGLLLIGSKAER
tara:strand:- start:913 stop:1095 length:183 start_codon:yes stop_codon:yes gene_type:complete